MSFQGIARGRWRAGKMRWSGQASDRFCLEHWVSHQIGTGWSWWREHRKSLVVQSRSSLPTPGKSCILTCKIKSLSEGHTRSEFKKILQSSEQTSPIVSALGLSGPPMSLGESLCPSHPRQRTGTKAAPLNLINAFLQARSHGSSSLRPLGGVQ